MKKKRVLTVRRQRLPRSMYSVKFVSWQWVAVYVIIATLFHVSLTCEVFTSSALAWSVSW